MKDNIFLPSNSKPSLTNEGYIMKRSIVGSVEGFEKHIKLNSYEIGSQSVPFRETKLVSEHDSFRVNPMPSTKVIDYKGLKQLTKEKHRSKNGFQKHESTYNRKKNKLDMLKRQSVEKMHKRGSRGYVILNQNSTFGTTKAIDESLQYNDAQTATVYFHDTDLQKFQRGEKVPLNENDIYQLEVKLQNREKRSALRKQMHESKYSKNQKLIDLKSKRHLEQYK